MKLKTKRRGEKIYRVGVRDLKKNLPRKGENGEEDPRKSNANTRKSPESIRRGLSEHVFDGLHE